MQVQQPEKRALFDMMAERPKMELAVRHAHHCRTVKRGIAIKVEFHTQHGDL